MIKELLRDDFALYYINPEKLSYQSPGSNGETIFDHALVYRMCWESQTPQAGDNVLLLGEGTLGLTYIEVWKWQLTSNA